MNNVRALEAVDIPQIVALRRRAFTQSAHASDESLASYYRMLFLENPWWDERYPALVYEGRDSQIQGFMGVIPRPYLLSEQRVTTVTCTEFMVAPEARGVVGPKLLHRLVQGSQDVSCSDRCTDKVKGIYEAMGGAVALWYSFYWTLPLDGSSLNFDGIARVRGRQGLLGRALRRAGRSLEQVSNRLRSDLAAEPIATRDEPLDPETVVCLLQRMTALNTLVPEYDSRSFIWLLQRLEERSSSGRVVTRQVTHEGGAIGWFVYTIRDGGEVEVVQLAALPAREALVFDGLVHHAIGEGATIMRGRLDRRFSTVISSWGLPLTLGQPWSVFRATRQDLAAQFFTGNAFFSRLDAEWWIGT